MAGLLLGVGVLGPPAPAGAEDEPALRPERLHVVDGRGRGIRGAVVYALRRQHEGRPLFTLRAPVAARATEAGVVDTLPDPRTLAGRLAAFAPGYAPALVPATGLETRVVLQPGKDILGRVRFAQGSPASGVAVVAVPLPVKQDGGSPSDPLAYETSTDAEGVYRFKGLPVGQYELSMRRSDRRFVGLGQVAAGDAAPDALLVGSASMAGRLLDADGSDNAAAAGVIVRLLPLPHDLGTPREATTDAKGRFLVGDLVPGIYRAELQGRGWRFDQATPHVEVRAGSTDYHQPWFVQRQQPIQGIVHDTDGRPLGRAQVSVLRRVPGDPEAEAQVHTARAVRTNAAGRFKLGPVAPGEGYRVVITARGYAPHISDPFEVKPRVGVSLNPIKLAPGWTLTVRVRDEKGRPVTGAAVRTVPAIHPSADVLPGWRAFVQDAETDAEGQVVLSDLPDDALRLTVASPGHLPVRVEVDAPHASRTRLENVSLVAAHRITGKVFREDGARPAGYVVRAIPRDGSTIQTLRTDASGTFRFPTLRPVATDLEVRALADGNALTLARVESVLPTSNPHVEIHVPPMHGATGVVTNLDPEIPGAQILVEAPRFDPVLERHRFETVLSLPLAPDPRGDAVFAIEDLPPGVYAIRAVQGTRDSSALPLYIRGEDVEDLRLPIPDGGSLGGAVIDGEGRGILGAIITLERMRGDGDVPRRPGGAIRITTDDAGSFHQDQVAPGVWRLRIDAEGYASETRDLRVSEGEAVVLEDVTLDAGATITGRVLHGSGEPLDGARVSLRRLEESKAAHVAVTDEKGRFVQPFLAPGAWVVVLEAETGGGRRPEALVEVTGDETAHVDFAVKGQARIEGTVTLRGRRIAGALLELEHEPDAAGLPRRRHRTETDETGRFRIDDLVAGTYRLSLEHGSARIAQWVDLDDVDRLTLDLEAREGRLIGKVVAAGGLRVAGADLLARELGEDGVPRSDGLVARGRTGPQGEFLLTGLPVGWYQIDVTAPGFPPGMVASAQAELEGADRPVTVVLGRGGEIELTLVDAAARPVRGGRIWIEDEAGVPYHTQPYASGPGGRIVIEGVPAGTARIRVQARGFGRAPLQTVHVSEGRAQQVRLVLERPGTLHLTVVGRGRDPVTRARITVRREDTKEIVEQRRPLRRIRLDTRWGYIPRTGELWLDELESGAYEVEVDAGPTYAVYRIGVDVEAGKITDAHVVMQPK